MYHQVYSTLKITEVILYDIMDTDSLHYYWLLPTLNDMTRAKYMVSLKGQVLMSSSDTIINIPCSETFNFFSNKCYQ